VNCECSFFDIFVDGSDARLGTIFDARSMLYSISPTKSHGGSAKNFVAQAQVLEERERPRRVL